MRLEKFEMGVIEEYWSNFDDNKKRLKHREHELLQDGQIPSKILSFNITQWLTKLLRIYIVNSMTIWKKS